MKLWPAENDDPLVGGFIAEMPSGVMKAVAWRSGAPIEPTIDAAKQYVSELLQCLIDGRHMDDVERTNWASATAAVQRIVADWNERTRARLYGATRH
jgi:hypothetical protein